LNSDLTLPITAAHSWYTRKDINNRYCIRSQFMDMQDPREEVGAVETHTVSGQNCRASPGVGGRVLLRVSPSMSVDQDATGRPGLFDKCNLFEWIGKPL
jgi:hypothetical protein